MLDVRTVYSIILPYTMNTIGPKVEDKYLSYDCQVHHKIRVKSPRPFSRRRVKVTHRARLKTSAT